MKKILVLGAGRSSSVLISYLLDNAANQNWAVTVGDYSIQAAQEQISNSHGNAIQFDINIPDHTQLISGFDLVISLLPPDFHLAVAKACIYYKKHLLTASYLTNEINALHVDAVNNDLIILMETGLDPGIDHMSALKEIDDIKSKGGKIFSFKSYTGGLVAPESDNNPWHYKISWNPRNVVLAGNATASYLSEGKVKYIPYGKIFERTDKIEVPDLGIFEGYANRDSLKYIPLYKLEGVTEFLRGTLRRPPYCKSWKAIVDLGLTDDSFKIPSSEKLTWQDFTTAFLPKGKESVKTKIANYLNLSPNNEIFQNLDFLGLFEDQTTGIPDASPAFLLQKRLEQKLMLQPNDKDMIVMQHLIGYEMDNQKKFLTSSLVVKGETSKFTAMAKTVGLPLAFAAENILNGKIKSRGVCIPIMKEIYQPILEELVKVKINFKNEVGEWQD